eukprot:c42029_g1_i1 orf=38-343(+)
MVLAGDWNKWHFFAVWTNATWRMGDNESALLFIILLGMALCLKSITSYFMVSEPEFDTLGRVYYVWCLKIIYNIKWRQLSGDFLGVHLYHLGGYVLSTTSL